MIRNKDSETVQMTLNEFQALAEYSTTYPTGVFPWKCWKRRERRLKVGHCGPLGEVQEDLAALDDLITILECLDTERTV